jgi:hypothetical protein
MIYPTKDGEEREVNQDTLEKAVGAGAVAMIWHQDTTAKIVHGKKTVTSTTPR